MDCRFPLKFPGMFPINAMGLSSDDFDLLVVGVVRKHAPDFGEGAVKLRSSRGGKYMCVTVTIRAVSQEQLETIYRELSDHERVMMAL